MTSEATYGKKAINYTDHLLKNELVKIDWCLNRIRKVYAQNSLPAPEEIDIIARSIAHLQNFIQKNLTYSGDIVLAEEKCRFKDIIEKSVILSKGSSGENICVEINCPDDLYILCDETHMTEVMNNLIQNSIESFTQQGTIEINCYMHDSKPYFCAAVHDNGPGIKQEYIPHLFEPYYTTKNTGKNFGLGLSYCLNVINKHHGFIDVESTNVTGTTFTLYFPAERLSFGNDS